MSVPMALVDYIPVIFFMAGAIVLQRSFYGRMSTGAFAVFSAGTIMITTAGLFKATWKLLYALGVCDFERLNQCFFPMQSVGFLLAGLAMAGYLFFPKRRKHLNSLTAAGPAAVLEVFGGTFVFVGVMGLGALGLCGGLAVEARRQKKTGAMVLFIVSFVFLLAMGYLSSKDFEQAYMNWVAEAVNCVGLLAFLLGTCRLSKAEAAGQAA